MADEYPNQAIFERDDFTCRYCGWRGDRDFSNWFVANLSIDHIKPVSAGGTDSEANLVVACHSCNLYKGSHVCESFEEAKAFVELKRAQAEKWFNKHVLKR
ncbi:HNH endonuclease [Sedimenticola hydrogenitrophicus]|uniref:HNH endonuclease n=1 Tax=Sedimenticola hydrogenitrophicus TaxID=2967975 RepID=UPI0023B03AF5|nr:HNH endonuclease [Sedimenticola hydrogenitrophicus]